MSHLRPIAAAVCRRRSILSLLLVWTLLPTFLVFGSSPGLARAPGADEVTGQGTAPEVIGFEPPSGAALAAAPAAPTGLTKITPDVNPFPVFKWTPVSLAVSYEIQIDPGAWTNIGNKLVYIQPTILSIGSHTFSVRARDTSGVTGPAATLAFTVFRTDGTNTRIAFHSNRDGNYEIYTMKADGTDVVRLTNNSASDKEPVYSPDGTKIAFTSWRDGNSEIYVMNADGTSQTRLTYNSGEDSYPAWSPDGAKIAFQTTRDGNWEIYSMNANGSGQTRLTNSSSDDSQPSWSPDGARIAFHSNIHHSNFDILSMVSDGSDMNPGHWTYLAMGYTHQPAWSPNGAKIAFRNDSTGTSRVWTANSDGVSGGAYLNGSTSEQSAPKWSPDGATIVYRTADGAGKYEIATSKNGVETVRTNNSFDEGSPSFSAILPPVAPGNLVCTTAANDSTPTFTWTAANDAASYEVRLGSGSWSSAGNVTTYTWPAALADSSYTLSVHSLDFLGNAGGTASLNFSISAPPDNITGLAQVSPGSNPLSAFRWNAVTNAASYEVAVDTGAWSNIGNNPGYVHTSAVTPGFHYFWVRAKDAGGETGTAASLGFTVTRLLDLSRTRIAFQSNRDGNYEIYTMKPDGTDLRRLTNNAFSDTEPAWSPDASKIAFTSNRDGNSEIYVMNADGTGQTRLTSNTATDSYPAWSPDGAKIAFQSDRDGNWEVHVINSDGTGQTRLTNNGADDSQAGWSPDGTRIVFHSSRTNHFNIYSMNADGSGQTALNGDSFDYGQPVWSPNRLKVAASSNRDYWGFQIYTMNADGSGIAKLTDQGYQHYDNSQPSWSPDAARIIFQSSRDGNNELYIVNADGSGQTRLTNNGADDGNPAWSPILPSIPIPAPGISRVSGNDYFANWPAFIWTSLPEAASYAFAADAGDWLNVDNALTLSISLSSGPHTVRVRGVDFAGMAGSEASLTAFVGAPTGLARTSPDSNPLPIFKWDPTYAGATYDIQIDSGTWAPAGRNRWGSTSSSPSSKPRTP